MCNILGESCVGKHWDADAADRYTRNKSIRYDVHM